MNFLDSLQYHKSSTWSDNDGRIGITDDYVKYNVRIVDDWCDVKNLIEKEFEPGEIIDDFNMTGYDSGTFNAISPVF